MPERDAVSFALLDDRRILWEEAFGIIDKTRSLGPNPETLFCIASLSKIVAAVGERPREDRSDSCDLPAVLTLSAV